MLEALRRRLLSSVQGSSGPMSATPVQAPPRPVGWPEAPAPAPAAVRRQLEALLSEGIQPLGGADALERLWWASETASDPALAGEIAGVAAVALPRALARLPWTEPAVAWRACLHAIGTCAIWQLPQLASSWAQAESHASSLAERAIGPDGAPADGRLHTLGPLVRTGLAVQQAARAAGRPLPTPVGEALARQAHLLATLSLPDGRPPRIVGECPEGLGASALTAAVSLGWIGGAPLPGSSAALDGWLGLPSSPEAPADSAWHLDSFRAQDLASAWRRTRKGHARVLTCASPPRLELELDAIPVFAEDSGTLTVDGTPVDWSRAHLSAARVDGPGARVHVEAEPLRLEVQLRQARASFGVRTVAGAPGRVCWTWRLAAGWTLDGEAPKLTATHTDGRSLKVVLDPTLSWAHQGAELIGTGGWPAGGASLTTRWEWT